MAKVAHTNSFGSAQKVELIRAPAKLIHDRRVPWLGSGLLDIVGPLIIEKQREEQLLPDLGKKKTISCESKIVSDPNEGNQLCREAFLLWFTLGRCSPEPPPPLAAKGQP